jgi:hypothetical protein
MSKGGGIGRSLTVASLLTAVPPRAGRLLRFRGFGFILLYRLRFVYPAQESSHAN